MYQLFKIGFASATEYDIYRCKYMDYEDPGIKLGSVTMISETEWWDDFDEVGLITDAERDSVPMLVEAALDMVQDQPDVAISTGMTFEVDI
jgi:hypothetical protein